jgi:hypothetical protein
MTIIYTKKSTELGWEYIEMLDSDKPKSVGYIPIDEGNSDYQAYLATLVSESSTPSTPQAGN